MMMEIFQEDRVIIFGEIAVEDEYNPLVPNDYNELVARREVERRKQREEERKRDMEERDRYLAKTFLIINLNIMQERGRFRRRKDRNREEDADEEIDRKKRAGTILFYFILFEKSVTFPEIQAAPPSLHLRI